MSYVNLVRRAVRKTLGGRPDQLRNENGQFGDEGGGDVNKISDTAGMQSEKDIIRNRDASRARAALVKSYKPKTLDSMKRVIAGAQANEAVDADDIDRDEAVYEAEKIYNSGYYKKIKPVDLYDEFNYTFGIKEGATDKEMQGHITKLEKDYGW